MFKCLSVTEGNVALGPEVQVSVTELYKYSWSSDKLEWTIITKWGKENL